MIGARTYVLRSTGDVAVMLNAVNGLATVPPASRDESCDNDVGRLFYLSTHSWGSGAIAVFAYENASVLVEPLGGGEPVITVDLMNGEHTYVHEVGRRSFRVTSTGDIAVWTGDLEGGETIADMGDDFSCNLGRRGQDVVFHSQNHGATIYATVDDTTLIIGEEEHHLDEGEWIDVTAGSLARASADHPIVTFTFGGNTLNDWGGYLRPSPRETPETACPDLDADMPFPSDGDADADADFDMDEERDGDVELDADSTDRDIEDDSDISQTEENGEPRWSCDCRTARISPRTPASFLEILISMTNVVRL